MKDRISIGTRGSPLALAQTRQIVGLLQKSSDDIHYEIVTIRTSGDKIHDIWNASTEGKRLFTKEIEDSLLKGEIDMAVHSMKDLTAELPSGLTIAAVPERSNPYDVLVSRSDVTFRHLPKGARIGTSSSRRKAQLLAARKDLRIIDMHGNIGTRLRKLTAGEYDGIVLAAAGLIRLGLEDQISEFFSTDVILPAIGQGALAIQCREDDTAIRKLVSRIDHEPTRKAVQAERSFGRSLGADCWIPIAAHATVETAQLTINGMVAKPDGNLLVRDKIVSNNTDPEKTGQDLAMVLLNRGAKAILEAAR